MDRSSSSLLLSWLLVPVGAILVESALSLPRQPYTGLLLKNALVAEVIPGSPADRAGLLPGDRIEIPAEQRGRRFQRRPLEDAVPGRPLELQRLRGVERRRVWLVPDPLPDGERRVMAALLAVASGFVLLGGWVWSERRDRLARALFLLCLAFAWLLAPLPRWSAPALALLHDAILTGITLFLPALFIHFFALFPESRARGPLSASVGAGYAVATLLYVPSLIPIAFQTIGLPPAQTLGDVVQAAGALWFAAGLLTALGLFATSFRRAGSADARRRLRVAFAGTLLGSAPLAAAIAVRNLSPGTAVPGERWAVVLTLLVPASFAWSTVVHRIFDFRVALRTAAVIVLLAAVGAVVYGIGEWLAATWWPDLGAGIAGGALAFVALAACLAGPSAPWLGSLGARVVPGDEPGPLVSLSGSGMPPGAPAAEAGSAAGEPRLAGGTLARAPSVERVLTSACEAVVRYLKLDGCLALTIDGNGSGSVFGAGSGGMREPGPGLRLRAAHLVGAGIQAVADAPLEAADREALEMAGVDWLLPVGDEPVRAVLLLGRRLAGAWLGRRESEELERFADHLAVSLENAALRREATSRGALQRELMEAGAIQAHLLPRRAPVCPTLDCAAAALSCEPVGGDYYDFVEGEGRDFTLVVGDAAGKGIPAALLLAQVQARFRGEARTATSPGDLMSALNLELVRFDQPEKFVGLLCARVEVRTARVWFANAGLTPPLVRRRDGRFEEILMGGVLLGVSPHASYPDACVEMSAGDIVVVHTDGLTEARCGDELFGTERVREVLERARHLRAADILEALLTAVRAFADRPLDDLTVVVLKQLTDPVPVPRTRQASQEPLKWRPAAADLWSEAT